MVLLFVLYAYIAGDNGWWLPTTATTANKRTAVFWATRGLTFTLPSAVLAWTKPDNEAHSQIIRTLDHLRKS